MNKNYISFIDSLRAFSVISVFFFHFNEKFFPNGYLGVDVFFVISGFVITKVLMEEFQQKKSIGLFDFYLRRIKRLYPALLVMLTITLMFYIYLTFQENLALIIKSFLSSLFGLSNIFYHFSETDYFLLKYPNPFIHTWSLAIEEQFYVIFPVILLVILKLNSRFKKNFLFILFIIFFFLSFLIHLDRFSLIGSFYSPIAKSWELLAGCIAYLVLKKESKFFKFKKNSIFLIVFLLLMLLFINFELSNLFLVSSIVLLTIILLINSKQVSNYKILNNIYLNYFEKFSYSFYLWHLPVLFFLKYYQFDNTYIFLVGLSLSIIFSIISFHFIENPLRRKKMNLNLFKRKQTIIFISFLILILAFLIKPNNLNNSINSFVRSNIDNFSSFSVLVKSYPNFQKWSEINHGGKLECNRDLSSLNFYLRNCFKKKDSRKLIFLSGDSTAFSLVPTFENKSLKENFLYIVKDGMVITPNISYRKKNNIFSENRLVESEFEKIKDYFHKASKNYEKNYFVISNLFFTILFSDDIEVYYKGKILNSKQEKIQALKLSLNQMVNSFDKKNNSLIIVKNYNFLINYKKCKIKALFDKNYKCRFNYSQLRSNYKIIDKILDDLENRNYNVRIFDPTKYLCDRKKDLCEIKNSEYGIISFDGIHLSGEAAKKLGVNFRSYLDQF